jgi:DNA-binding response OmpR family regulator
MVSRPSAILLVEDEPDLRALVHEVLTSHGYRVLLTPGPAEALRTARTTTEPIDLLLTDIVMPDMNGLALAERLQVDRPEMKVLYMTGYSNDVVMAHGTPNEGALIQKPFTPRHIVARVREVLGDAEPAKA